MKKCRTTDVFRLFFIKNLTSDDNDVVKTFFSLLFSLKNLSLSRFWNVRWQNLFFTNVDNDCLSIFFSPIDLTDRKGQIEINFIYFQQSNRKVQFDLLKEKEEFSEVTTALNLLNTSQRKTKRRERVTKFHKTFPNSFEHLRSQVQHWDTKISLVRLEFLPLDRRIFSKIRFLTRRNFSMKNSFFSVDVEFEFDFVHRQNASASIRERDAFEVQRLSVTNANSFRKNFFHWKFRQFLIAELKFVKRRWIVDRRWKFSKDQKTEANGRDILDIDNRQVMLFRNKEEDKFDKICLNILESFEDRRDNRDKSNIESTNSTRSKANRSRSFPFDTMTNKREQKLRTNGRRRVPMSTKRR